jgi:hypothetical protein
MTMKGIQYLGEDVSKKGKGKNHGKMGKVNWSCELQGVDAMRAGHSFVSVEGLPEEFYSENNVESGVTTMAVEGAIINGTSMVIPNGVDPILGVDRRRLAERDARNLAVVTGTRSVLVVRVTAKDKSTTGSEAWLAEKVFTDGTSLKSQMSACSHGKLNFIPATGTGVTSGGTMTVSLSTTSVNGNEVSPIEELIEAAVKVKAGISSSTSLSSKFNHVMFCVPSGTVSDGDGW